MSRCAGHPSAVLHTSGTAACANRGNTASVTSTATGTATATVRVSAGPLNIAIDAAGTTAYVTKPKTSAARQFGSFLLCCRRFGRPGRVPQNQPLSHSRSSAAVTTVCKW